MAHLEPNWPALAVFGLVWGACCVAFLTLVGMVPLLQLATIGPVSIGGALVPPTGI